MSETPSEERSAGPVTVASMTSDCRDLGLTEGDTVLVHRRYEADAPTLEVGSEPSAGS